MKCINGFLASFLQAHMWLMKQTTLFISIWIRKLFYSLNLAREVDNNENCLVIMLMYSVLVLVYLMSCKLVLGLDMNLRITSFEISVFFFFLSWVSLINKILFLKKKELSDACNEIVRVCLLLKIFFLF